MRYSKVEGIAPYEYLYSTTGNQFDSYTLASGLGSTDDKGNYYLNKGEVLAVITSGDAAGKVGPYDTTASDGRETASNIVGFNDTFVDDNSEDADVGVLYKGTVDETYCTCDGTLGTISGAAAAVLCDNGDAGLDITIR